LVLLHVLAGDSLLRHCSQWERWFLSAWSFERRMLRGVGSENHFSTGNLRGSVAVALVGAFVGVLTAVIAVTLLLIFVGAEVCSADDLGSAEWLEMSRHAARDLWEDEEPLVVRGVE
jgi:integral membrane sensor domain MASE1